MDEEQEEFDLPEMKGLSPFSGVSVSGMETPRERVERLTAEKLSGERNQHNGCIPPAALKAAYNIRLKKWVHNKSLALHPSRFGTVPTPEDIAAYDRQHPRPVE